MALTNPSETADYGDSALIYVADVPGTLAQVASAGAAQRIGARLGIRARRS